MSGQNIFQVPLSPPQIPRDLLWDDALGFEVRNNYYQPETWYSYADSYIS
jgi:hypothetical protein